MNDKSHVSMERRLCVVCGTEYDTGAILLDQRLRASLERFTTTGWGMCGEHQRLHDDGYIALIECNSERSGIPTAEYIDPQKAFRTGPIAHLKREVFDRMFDRGLPANQSCVFVTPEVIELLHRLSPPIS